MCLKEDGSMILCLHKQIIKLPPCTHWADDAYSIARKALILKYHLHNPSQHLTGSKLKIKPYFATTEEDETPQTFGVFSNAKQKAKIIPGPLKSLSQSYHQTITVKS